MDLRKEIQVALNNCQPNTNRVDKIEAIAQKYAEFYHALQLQQTGVMCSFLNFVAEKHYRLVNVDTLKNIHWWKDEKGIKTSEQLLQMFKEPYNHKHIWNNDVCEICNAMKFG
jgi:hypothetical protein